MSKRSYPLRFECKHAGCKESTTYRFDTLRDLRGSFELKHDGKEGWLCIRHQRPDEVLSADNPQIVTELINEEHEHGRFLGNRRFVYGPGFKAFAQDFPPGTRLLITARVEFPSAAPAAEPVAWQPIETAPKDGTRVLVCPGTWSNTSCAIARWRDDQYAKRPRPYWHREDALSITRSRDIPPTHWQPLPTPPAVPHTKESSK